jgi:hypothetical protein
MIGVDWIAGLPTKEGGFYAIHHHAKLLPGKVPTRATAAVVDAAEIMYLCSGDGFPDVTLLRAT